MAATLYLCLHLRERAGASRMHSAGSMLSVLLRCAGHWTPRIEVLASRGEARRTATLLLDCSGSVRLLGSGRHIAGSVRQEIQSALHESGRGSLTHNLSIAVSQNASAAILAARGLAGITIISAGDEAATLAPLSVAVLEPDTQQAQTLAHWGIRTLGQLTALPTRALAARLGPGGLLLQAQARGEHRHLLVPIEEAADAPLSESLALEHPIESIEPLLFLLHGMLERLTAHAARRALAIAAVELRCELDASADKSAANAAPEHRLLLRPALPERSPRTLLKLLQLELDAHPPSAAVIALHLTVFPARPQRAQHGLFSAQAPEAGGLEILLARLRKLTGAGRVGSPELLDSHAPEAFRMAAFHPETSASPACEPPAPALHPPALRMLRPPRAVSVELRDGRPSLLRDEGERFLIRSGSGPWRSSGGWWNRSEWCREEWDVVVEQAPRSGARHNDPPPQSSPPARCLRLAHDPASADWYILGAYD